MNFSRYIEHFRDFRESFGFRIFSAFMAVVLIILMIFLFMDIYWETTNATKNLAKKGKMIAGFLAHSVRTGIFAENTEDLKNIASGVIQEDDVVSVSIYSADWRVLYKTQKKPFENKGADVYQTTAWELQGPKSFKIIETHDAIEYLTPVTLEVFPNLNESLYLEEAATPPTEKIIGYVHIGMDKKILRDQLKAIFLTVLLMVFMIALSGTFIIYIASRKVTKPLMLLTENVRMLGIEGAAEKIEVESNDEIGKLAAAFNKMAADLLRREDEKKALEEQLLQGKKMEALGTLSRGIAHDFNNILSTIQGSIFILRKKMDQNDSLQQYVKKIQTSLVRAQNLIQSLLSFSRGQIADPAPFNINTLITNLIPFCESLSDEHIQCTFSLSDTDLIVRCDKTQIEQVLLNLISNACHAMPGGGVLSIATNSVVVYALMRERHPNLMPGTYALVTVTDTGRGMREDIKEHIFEPFFTTKEVGEGMGLGLSIAYGIVKHYNGLIDVSSRLGEGTTFEVYLPIHEEKKNSIGFPE